MLYFNASECLQASWVSLHKKKKSCEAFHNHSLSTIDRDEGFGRAVNVSNTKLQSLHREEEDTMVQAFRH